MRGAPASVIVRAKNEERFIGRALEAVRRQTVNAEVIVVDSGSTDRTLEIAGQHADSVIEIPPENFSFGRALNVGARAASAPVHFALSAHCFPPRPDWIERSLAHYRRDDVAGAAGSPALPDGRPLTEPPGSPLYFSNSLTAYKNLRFRSIARKDGLAVSATRPRDLSLLEAGVKRYA